LDVEPFPLELGAWQLVTVESGATHTHAGSGYNERRAECRAACEALGVDSLREATSADGLAEPLDRRVRHVLEENARVDAAVAALDHGADDYIPDTCEPVELLARLRAALRRVRWSVRRPAALLARGVLRLDPDRRRVTVADNELYLPPREYALLHDFMSHAGEVLPLAALQRAVWGMGFGESANSARACIASLRRKLDRAGCPPGVIRTIPGVGYILPAGEATSD
jgi:hypothetical protein